MNGSDTMDARARDALARPSNFGTADPDAFTTHGAVFSVNRDSDAVARANWQAFRTALDAHDDDVYVMGCRHWAVGWIDHLMVRVRDDGGAFTPAFTAACGLLDALEECAVLDESLCSEIEWADNHPDADELCYADADTDCPCGRESVR